MNNHLPFEILQEVLLHSDFISQIRMRQLNKFFNRLEIHDFLTINSKYSCRLNDNILNNYPFIRKLNARNNKNITNVNHMTKLQKIEATLYCGINDDGIKNLNLIELIMYGNNNITNINHMKNLTLQVKFYIGF